MNPENIFQLDPPGTYEITLADGSKGTVTIVYDGDVDSPEQKHQRLNEERLAKLSQI